MASVNTSMIKHNLLLALDDRGKISCHKVEDSLLLLLLLLLFLPQVNLCFLFFDPKQCVARLGEVLAERPDQSQGEGAVFDREAYLRWAETEKTG